MSIQKDMTFEYVGSFWEPGGDKSKIGGVLRLRRGEGLTLELIGGLAETEGEHLWSDFPILLGHTVDGLVTLAHCHATGGTEY